MSVIYILITVSLIIAVFFLIAFILAVKNGQFDDSVTPSIRMLFDNKPLKTNQPVLKSSLKNGQSEPLEKS